MTSAEKEEGVKKCSKILQTMMGEGVQKKSMEVIYGSPHTGCIARMFA